MYNLLSHINLLHSQGKDLALCTIVSAKGSVPLGTGAKMIVANDGSIYGTVGGGYVEKQTIDTALKMIEKDENKLLPLVLSKDTGTCCGGKVQIFIEIMKRKKRLYIFGGGHVCKALLDYLPNFEFDTTVIDDRQEIFDDSHFNDINTVVSNFNDYLNVMQFGNDVFIIIITYSHSADYQILSHCLRNQWQYLGMMGSMNKVKTMSKRLIDEGIKKVLIKKVNMPIGININAETTHEIAISILAELIETTKNKK